MERQSFRVSRKSSSIRWLPGMANRSNGEWEWVATDDEQWAMGGTQSCSERTQNRFYLIMEYKKYSLSETDIYLKSYNEICSFTRFAFTHSPSIRPLHIMTINLLHVNMFSLLMKIYKFFLWLSVVCIAFVYLAVFTWSRAIALSAISAALSVHVFVSLECISHYALWSLVTTTAPLTRTVTYAHVCISFNRNNNFQSAYAFNWNGKKLREIL